MMNFNEEGYFQVQNKSQNQIAFLLTYVAGGSPISGYVKNFDPGMTKQLTVPCDATNIEFAIYMYKPVYELIPIFKGSFDTVAQRCYSVSGNLQQYLVSRVLCSNPSNDNNCTCNCNCSCNCHNSYYNSDYTYGYNC